MSTRCHFALIFAAVLSALAASSHTFAQENSNRQERLFALIPELAGTYHNGPYRFVEIDTSVDAFGTILRTVPAGFLEGGLRPLAGGRYIVGTSAGLQVFDTKIGTIFPFATAGRVLALDTHRPRIFLADGSRTTIIDARSGATSSLPIDTNTFTRPVPATHAGLTDRLFVVRASDNTVVDVVDVAAGAIVQSIATGRAIGALATDSSGERLYVLSHPEFYPWQLSAYAPGTGALINRVTFGTPTYFDNRAQLLQFDDERQRLLVGALVVFDANTLDRLGETPGICGTYTGWCNYGFWNPAFTFTGPRSPLIFLSSVTFGGGYISGPSGCRTAPLERRDPDTGALQRVADLGNLLTAGDPSHPRCAIEMVMMTVPPTPRAFTSVVQGRQVTLSWIDPGNSTHFDIEVGSSPGTRNLLSQALGGTTFTVNDVPPGTYYVRVRAINEVGRSLPSADLTIVIP